jgi:hypothetical protein
MPDDVDIQQVQTAKLRRQGTDEHWSAIVSITEAVREAGLEDGGSFRFDPSAADELGMVPAIGSEETVDGRTQPLTRNIKQEGAGGNTLRLVLPDEVLEALDIDADAIDWEDPPEVSVWTGDRLLAFESTGEQTVQVNLEDAGQENEEDTDG